MLFTSLDALPNRYFVQIGGRAFRMSVDVLRRELREETPLKHILETYNAAFIAFLM